MIGFYNVKEGYLFPLTFFSPVVLLLVQTPLRRALGGDRSAGWLKGAGLGHTGPSSASSLPPALDSGDNPQSCNRVQIHWVISARGTARAEHHRSGPRHPQPPFSLLPPWTTPSPLPAMLAGPVPSSILPILPTSPNVPLEKVPGVFIFLPHSGKGKEPQLQSLLGLNSILWDTSKSKFTAKYLWHST